MTRRPPSPFWRRVRFFFLLALFLLLLLAVAALLAFRRYEFRRLYHPSPDVPRTPHALQLDYQPVAFTASDNVPLAGWWLAAPRPRAIVVVFPGPDGNAAGAFLDHAPFFHDNRLSLFLWDYRGYGLSADSGRPSEAGLRRDAQAALEVARQMNRKSSPPLPIVLYGHSTGAALALHAAAENPDGISALVLSAPFPSVSAILERSFPSLPFPLDPFVSQRYDATPDLARLPPIPKLVAANPDDPSIPFPLTVQFVRTCPAPVTVVTLDAPTASHPHPIHFPPAKRAHRTSYFLLFTSYFHPPAG
ncbi:MAG: alpha/beta fold hydrolase, partial [Kiritimatiellae bacterium]|nr:alpha/beta fold hydrolase [Kiritimatiellia bacterium]